MKVGSCTFLISILTTKCLLLLYICVNKAPSFGNWTICPFDFTYKGQTARVNCSEQGLMWAKAILFDDKVSATNILKQKDPKKQKALGRLVKNFNQKVWDSEAYNLMVLILIAKFEQNEDYAKALLATENKLLVEASSFDNLWGVKLTAKQCIDAGEDPSAWKGKNLLGYALMDTRKYLHDDTFKKKITMNSEQNLYLLAQEKNIVG